MRVIWNSGDENHGTELGSMIRSAVTLSVICPYIRDSEVERLLGGGARRRIRVMTLWSWRCFLDGATEPQALKRLLQLGAQVRAMREGLHAKVYVVDDSTALVTSANLTRGGLTNNMECGVAFSGPEVAAVLRQFELDWRRAAPLTEDQLDQVAAELSRVSAKRDALAERLRSLEEELSQQSPGPASVWTQRPDELRVELTPDQVEFLSRPVHGQGGYQSLLSRLQNNMVGSVLTLTQSDCERVVRYATQYGQGGFQERLRSIVEQAELFSS